MTLNDLVDRFIDKTKKPFLIAMLGGTLLGYALIGRNILRGEEDGERILKYAGTCFGISVVVNTSPFIFYGLIDLGKKIRERRKYLQSPDYSNREFA